MTPAWYARMNPRERKLSWMVGSVIFVLINFFVWSWLLGAINNARAELAVRKSARQEQSVYMNERELWQKRDQWVKERQPAFQGSGDASTLLDELKAVAGKHSILIENPALGAGENTPNHQAVFASIDTKSPWPPLVHFLYDVQQPENFVVFESVNLAIDSGDPTMMRGKFKIARWFAPGQRRK